jgi:putative oxidoreductase
MQLPNKDKLSDLGLLVLRIGIGLIFIYHGYPKLLGGPDVWNSVGGALMTMGIDKYLTFFGFMAALSEFGGGLLLAIGLLVRPASAFLFITMVVATMMHVKSGDSFTVYSHALKCAVLFFSLILIGPGKMSLDAQFFRKN